MGGSACASPESSEINRLTITDKLTDKLNADLYKRVFGDPYLAPAGALAR
jgi:hypothetical protein